MKAANPNLVGNYNILSDFGMLAMDQEVPGARLVSVRGRIAGLNTGALPQTVAFQEGDITGSFATGVVSVWSNDADDDTVAEGARTVYYEYLDENWDLRSATGELVSAAFDTPSLNRVLFAKVATCGAEGENKGTITFGSPAQLAIPGGEGISSKAHYATPRSWNGYILSAFVETPRTTAVTGMAALISRDVANSGPIVYQDYLPFDNLAPTVKHYHPSKGRAPLKISEKTDLWINVTVATAAVDIYAGFTLLLIND